MDTSNTGTLQPAASTTHNAASDDAAAGSSLTAQIVTPAPAATFADKVHAVLARATQAADGSLVLAAEDANLSPELDFAVKAEKRVRDNQSAYTKARQEAKKHETIATKLTQHILANVVPHLSVEEQAELETLKLTDPDAWRSKLGELETKTKSGLQAKLQEIEQEGADMSELEVRQVQLAQFVQETGIQLDDRIIEEQLPAAYTKELSSGKITFDQFLVKARDFLLKGKVIEGAGTTPKTKPSLATLPGGSQPSAPAQEGDSLQRYAKETY